MDAKAKARTSPTAKKDLAIKESILGVLNAKDKTGKGSIPISEFENVIDAFGVSWDSPAVQNVLNHCKVEKNERMNFSSLKEELKLEKERLHAKPSGRYTRAPLTAPAVPQASGILKEKREALKEKQRRAVQVQTDQIHTIYNMLSRHDIDKSTAINLLSQYQIYPTKELVKIASEMEVNDVPFGEFSRALTASEPYSRTSEILASETSTVFAGGSRRTPVDRFGTDEAVPGRRLFEIPKSQHFAPPDEAVQMGSFKPGRKLLDQARGRRHLIVDDEIGVDYARAQLNHGNCVTWQCDITELEERNAALEKPEGRKIDDQQLVCNYFSDVISWGNFREEGSAEDAARQEFAMIGGLSVAQGNRNRTSAKNILAWDSAGNKPGGSKKSADFNTSFLPAAASAAVTNIGEIDRGTAPSPNLVKSLSQNDLLLAGSPSLRPERPKLRTFGIYTNGTSGGSGYRSSGGSPVVVPPFGVDGPSLSKSSSPSSFYNRGRTPSGTLFKSDSFNSCSNSNSNSPMSSPNGKSPPNGHSVGVSARNWL